MDQQVDSRPEAMVYLIPVEVELVEVMEVVTGTAAAEAVNLVVVSRKTE